MTDIESTPLEEPGQNPEWQPFPAEGTPETAPETDIVPESGVIEGEFIDITSSPPAQTTTEPHPETAKRKLSPAMLALITILGLFALCCLMAIIVFFLVYPTAREQSVGFVPLVLSSLAG